MRQVILAVIERNPGLHFREIQRRTYSATGQLEYHLYQLEKENRIVKREDGKLKRYFSNETGTNFERTLLYHMRNRESARIISTVLQKNTPVQDLVGRSKTRLAAVMDRVGDLEKDGIIKAERPEDGLLLKMEKRDEVLRILKKYRESFLDSLAMNLLSLLE